MRKLFAFLLSCVIALPSFGATLINDTETEKGKGFAIAGITPGPIGLNMATFAGFKTLGIFGAATSSFALVLPMIVISTLVFRLYKKFSENKYE